MARTFLLLGSLFMFLGVAIGAFAAHSLKSKLSPELFAIFEVGVRYHIYHALGLIAVGLLSRLYPQLSFTSTGWLLTAGIVIFSGSLYALSITGTRWLGAITPIGGLCFLAGWFWLAWTLWKSS